MYARNEDKLLCCPFCDRVEEHANTLYYHIKREHEKKFDYECKYCEYKTYSKSILDQHIKNKHPEKLINHTSSQNLLKNYSCPICNTESTSKGNLKTHIARNHATWIQEYKPNKSCQHCTTQLKSATSYYYHCLSCIPVPDSGKNVYEQFKKSIK
jgi:transcription elongation factor Elf1